MAHDSANSVAFSPLFIAVRKTSALGIAGLTLTFRGAI